MTLFLNPVRKTFSYGNRTVTLETGLIAKQAKSVMVHVEGTSVLVTVVTKKTETHRDFFPLSVHYQERTYSVGKIPGGYFKREGRPSERETLVSRLIDRPIRPLFSEGYCDEVQVVATVLSINPDIDPDIFAIIGASAALMLSGIPFKGPVAAARIAYVNQHFLLNPTSAELAQSELDLVVAGTEQAVLMVESEAKLLSEAVMLDAVWEGHAAMQVVIQAIKEFVAEAGSVSTSWIPAKADEALASAVKEACEAKLAELYQIPNKADRFTQLEALRKQVIATLITTEADSKAEGDIRKLIDALEKKIVRTRILEGHSRIDGRDTRTVRPLDIRVGILERTHGSALFTRGETQALVVTTLGTERDAQSIDNPIGDTKERFMLHYNFPPYSVGEVGMLGSPKRREIGHGRLAKRGIQAVLPPKEQFSYVLRVVSEITESNGSSSMASICGSSLSLMDAGVPIKAPVAGIAMGLIKDGNKFAILSDILGDEDHLGDMDFKVAGTSDGISALQMDIKIDGINRYIMEMALTQAKEGRLHILGRMNAVISQPRTGVSKFAPSIRSMKIHPDKIRDVIGKGGSTIRAITEETKATIDINDEGVITIAAVDGAAGQAAWDRIQSIVAEAELGKIYEGKIKKLIDFGAFVEILPGKDAFLHISEIREGRVNNIRDELSEGQKVRVKVIEIDSMTHRIRATMKPAALLS